MAGAEDILLRLVLSGSDDVVLQLGRVGEAGAGAFGKMAQSGGVVGEALAGVVAAVTAAGGALFEWSKHSATATFELSHLAAASNQSLSEMSGLRGALTEMGADTDKLGMAFRRLAVRIETEWQSIVKSIKDRRDEMVNDMLSVEKATIGVEEAQAKLTETMAKYGSTSLEGRKAMLALEEAEQKEREARKKQEEDRKNSIEELGKAVDAVAKGEKSFQEAAKDANLSTIDNVLKGLVASSGTAGLALQNFKGDMQSLVGQEPGVRDVFLKLADFMKNSQDATLNTALAFKLFGRGVGEDMVQALSKGSAAILEEENRLKLLNLTLNEHDKHVSEKFVQSYRALSGELTTTTTQLGNLFAPGFTQGLEVMRKALEENHDSIVKWATNIAKEINPIITDFFRLISGGAPQTNWVRELAEQIKMIGDGFKTAFDYAEKFIALINKTTGLNIPGLQGIADKALGREQYGPPAPGQPVPGSGLLDRFSERVAEQGGWIAGIKRMFGIESPDTKSGSPPGLPEAAPGEPSIKEHPEFKQTIVRGGRSREYYVPSLEDYRGEQQQKQDDRKKRIEQLRSEGKSVIEIQRGTGRSNRSEFIVLEPPQDEGRARGGPIHGSGSETSDSIPIWASHNEFMMQAKAVNHYGSGFMHAVNEMKLPRFGVGGLIDRISHSYYPAIRMATGGPVGGDSGPGLHPVTIALPGGGEIKGFHATPDAVEQMARHASEQRTSRTGRMPDWWQS